MDLNRVIGQSLRTGVLLGAFLSILGLTLWVARDFQPVDPSAGLNVLDILHLAFSGNEGSIIYLGVIVVIATPVFRVAISVVAFGMEDDRQFVGITLIVLVMLIVALFANAAG